MTPLRWEGDCLRVLDQALLPLEERWLDCRTHEDVARAVTNLAVRGAPAIGIAAGFGLVLAARAGQDLARAAAELEAARPTAVNLSMAVRRVAVVVDGGVRAMEREAQALWQEDRDSCAAMGRAGLDLVPDAARILTHCNTGALATGGDGTALAVVRAAHDAGRLAHVHCTETRPWLQGARLTAWELGQDGIPRTLLTDSAAAGLMQSGGVDLVILGADRVAANGDVANKVGTLSLALAAHVLGIPFYVAIPLTTLDRDMPSGEHIRIEQRDADEVRCIRGVQIAEPSTPVFNPVFDVTPARYVTAFVTDAGVLRPPFGEWPVT
jgi:methylthioribose-1-phosphate isomerase